MLTSKHKSKESKHETKKAAVVAKHTKQTGGKGDKSNAKGSGKSC